MKKIIHKRYLLAPLFAVMLHFSAQGQWLKVNRPQAGLSLGFGGMHTWGKPSFDLNVGRWTFRAAPGLHYMSGGVTYKIGFYKPRTRTDRMFILSFYYANDWLLSNGKSKEFRKDENLYMLMPGIHVNLDYRGRVYFEVSGGLLYAHERQMTQDKEVLNARDHFIPMGEVRLGGIFQSRIEYHQDFPHKVKNPPVHKIKQLKLKFKKT